MGYTNGCTIPHTLRRNDIYYVYFRFTERQFFRCSLGLIALAAAGLSFLALARTYRSSDLVG
jgi:hypothetical protein